MFRNISKVRRVKGERGGAMVELTVLMLVFVPLILLPMYFQDALRYKLEVQEAVFSSAWDFAFSNYEQDSADSQSAGIASANQNIYQNLWCGNDRAKPDPAGPWADFNWEQEISCSAEESFGNDGYSELARSYNTSGYGNKGGLVTCTGTISVTNHYIPEFFLQEFASKNLFDPAKNRLVYPETKFGVLVDPWTIHDPADVQKDGQGNQAFKNRVVQVWRWGSSAMSFFTFYAKWGSFILSMIQEDISFTAGAFDLSLLSLQPRLTSLHFPNRMQRVEVSGGRSNFYVSPYEDGQDNKYRETFNQRDTFYLGCKEFGSDCH